MKKRGCLVNVAILFLFSLNASGCQMREHQSGNFSIYLLSNDLSVEIVKTIPLSDLNLDDKPLISIDDIISYTRLTHEIQLSEGAYQNINQMAFHSLFALGMNR